MRAIANTIAVGCAIWGLVSGPALAEDDDIYARDGVYLLLQGNYFPAFFDISSADYVSLGLDPTTEVDGGWGASGRFGYRFHPRWAAELQVEWISSFEFEIPGTETKEAEINDGVNFSANGKFYVFKGRFQPYAVLGVGVTSFQLEDGAGSPLGAKATDFISVRIATQSAEAGTGSGSAITTRSQVCRGKLARSVDPYLSITRRRYCGPQRRALRRRRPSRSRSRLR